MHKVFTNIQSEVNTDSELNSEENKWQDIWHLLLKRPSQKCSPVKSNFKGKSTTLGVPDLKSVVHFTQCSSSAIYYHETGTYL